MQTKSSIRISEIKDEITPESQICTLEQAEVYVKAAESFMEEMKPTEMQGLTVSCIDRTAGNMTGRTKQRNSNCY